MFISISYPSKNHTEECCKVGDVVIARCTNASESGSSMVGHLEEAIPLYNPFYTHHFKQYSDLQEPHLSLIILKRFSKAAGFTKDELNSEKGTFHFLPTVFLSKDNLNRHISNASEVAIIIRHKEYVLFPSSNVLDRETGNAAITGCFDAQRYIL